MRKSRRLIKSNAYTDGYDAYYNRLEKSDNPYFKAANPIEQQEWERGWDVAEQDYKARLFGAQEEDEMLYNSHRPVMSDLNVEDEAAYWDGLEDAACGLAPADEDDPSYMKGYRNGKKRSGRKSYADKICNDELASSRRINSSQKGYENVVDGTPYDDYHIDTRGMGILDVEHIINEIEGRGNQAVLTVQTSDGATQHTQFNAKDWKAYKDAVNGVDEFSRNSGTKGAAITDVWVTEVQGGSYVRNSRRPVKSARFLVEDENGEVIAEADTYEEAQTVNGATIIDTQNEQEEGGLFQSKKETTKQTMTRILSSIVSGEMTEEEAAEEIAEANDCNIGYARTILSYYMEDKERYLTSGMLELGESLNVDFDPDGNLDSWSVDFATDPEKPAPTLGGELVRAARLIIRSFRDNAEKIGWGYAREYLNPAARFIIDNTDYDGNNVIQDFLNGKVYDDDKYEEWINDFETDFADYLRDHPEYFEKLNKEDFTQNTEEGDEYGSIDYFAVSNEHFDYWFSYEDGQYVCDSVDNGNDPEFQEGDVITSEDYLFDGIDFDQEYGSFSEDGFTYWWEDGDGESVRISDVEMDGGEFEEGDVLKPEELKELAEEGYKFRDANGVDIKISDIL